MYLRGLSIRNLKRVRALDLDFTRAGGPRPFTVFVGENGLCKTALLQSIALAASGPDRANQLADAQTLGDVRDGMSATTIRATFGFGRVFHRVREYPGITASDAQPPELESRLEVQPLWRVFKGRSKYVLPPGNEVDGAVDPLQESRGKGLPYWFVAGYGAQRDLPSSTYRDAEEEPQRDRLAPLFDRGVVRATAFAEVFRSPTLVQAYDDLLRQALVESGLLPSVTGASATTNALPGTRESVLSHLHFGPRAATAGGRGPDAAREEGPQVPLAVHISRLSQGYRSTIAWIADLIGQALRDAGQPLALGDIEGLALVDELDLHLHPRWQVELVPALKRTFPKVQFIATTHSPMILPGLEQDEIVMLSLDDRGNVIASEAPEAPALKTGSEIYEQFFGIDRLYPSELGEALQRYGFLANDPGRTDAEEDEMQRLRSELREHGVDPGWEPEARIVGSVG